MLSARLASDECSAWHLCRDTFESEVDTFREHVNRERTVAFIYKFDLDPTLTTLQKTAAIFGKAAGHYSGLGGNNPAAINIVLALLPEFDRKMSADVLAICNSIPIESRRLPDQSPMGCTGFLRPFFMFTIAVVIWLMVLGSVGVIRLKVL